MGKYSIKELENLSGIKAHTLRIWEKRYKLFEPIRTATNIRYYSDNDLRKLLSVSLLNSEGLKISKIVAMGDGEIKTAIQQLKKEDIINKRRINDLIFPMLDYNEDEFNELFANYTDELGTEKTFTEVIYPFLEMIGILWLSDELNPSHEHFVIHIIRQKLSSAIEALPKVESGSKKALLFLPEGEFHELGLLFFAFLYKKRGVKVYYFGQSVPLNLMKDATEKIKPNWILTYSIVKRKNAIEKVLTELKDFTADKIYFLENKYQEIENVTYPVEVSRIRHFNEAISEIQG